MSTATRTADPNGAVSTDAGAVAVDSAPPLPFAALAFRHKRPVVVIDLERARRQHRALREAFPYVDVHYDIGALTHPALLRSMASGDAALTIAHEQVLPALLRAGADAGRLLLSAPAARPSAASAAFDLGVRRFVIDGMADLAVLAQLASGETVGSAPVQPLLRLQPTTAPGRRHRALPGATPAEAVRLAGSARDGRLPLQGLSLTLPALASPAEYVAEIVHAAAVSADIEAATGRRLPLLDLGGGFPGRSATHAAEREELARALRGIVAPATSGTTIIASAGPAVTAGCLTIVADTVQQDVDATLAGEYIDAGAEVVVLPDDAPRFPRLPFFRGTGGGAHRRLRGRGRTTWPAD